MKSFLRTRITSCPALCSQCPAYTRFSTNVYYWIVCQQHVEKKRKLCQHWNWKNLLFIYCDCCFRSRLDVQRFSNKNWSSLNTFLTCCKIFCGTKWLHHTLCIHSPKGIDGAPVPALISFWMKEARFLLTWASLSCKRSRHEINDHTDYYAYN